MELRRKGRGGHGRKELGGTGMGQRRRDRTGEVEDGHGRTLRRHRSTAQGSWGHAAPEYCLASHSELPKHLQENKHASVPSKQVVSLTEIFHMTGIGSSRCRRPWSSLLAGPQLSGGSLGSTIVSGPPG